MKNLITILVFIFTFLTVVSCGVNDSSSNGYNLSENTLLVYAKHAHIDFEKQELYLTHVVYHEVPENYKKSDDELRVYFDSNEDFNVAKTLIGDYGMVYLKAKNDSLFYKIIN